MFLVSLIIGGGVWALDPGKGACGDTNSFVLKQSNVGRKVGYSNGWCTKSGTTICCTGQITNSVLKKALKTNRYRVCVSNCLQATLNGKSLSCRKDAGKPVKRSRFRSAKRSRPKSTSHSGKLKCQPDTWSQLWSDKGSGARKSVSFWVPSTGYYLGVHAQPSHSQPPGSACAFSNSSLLKKPTGVKFVWNDKGSGAKRNVTIWKPNCPSGYYALGYMVEPNYNGKPNLSRSRFRCVHKDLVSRRSGTLKFVWNDSKSGAKDDVSVWGYTGYTGNNKFQVISPKFFYAHRSHRSLGKQQYYQLTNGTLYIPKTRLDKKTLMRLTRQYAPKIYLSKEERYFPSSVEHYINITREFTDSEGKKGLMHRNHSSKTRKGDLKRAKVYVHIKVFPTYTDIQYWVFSPFNGPGTARIAFGVSKIKWGKYKNYVMDPCGQHEGDWEHVSVRIDHSSKKAKAVYFEAHGDGKWYSGRDMASQFEGGRFIAYMSKFGKGFYRKPGGNDDHFQEKVVYKMKLLNITDKGHPFDASNRLQYISAHDHSNGDRAAKRNASILKEYGIREPSWIKKYPGRWGRQVLRKNSSSLVKRLKKTFGKKIGQVISNAIYNVFKKVGLGTCTKENGPVAPWSKEEWTGPEPKRR